MSLEATHLRTSTALRVAITIAISFPITLADIGTFSSTHFSIRNTLSRTYWSRTIGGSWSGALTAGAADATFQFKISAVDSNVNTFSRDDDAAQSQSDPRDGERYN